MIILTWVLVDCDDVNWIRIWSTGKLWNQ